jgi:hypothetical protein
LWRLNAAANLVGVDYVSSSSERRKHIICFLQKIKDDQAKALASRALSSMVEVEEALEVTRKVNNPKDDKGEVAPCANVHRSRLKSELLEAFSLRGSSRKSLRGRRFDSILITLTNAF